MTACKEGEILRTSRIAFLSVMSNTFVVAMKIVVGLITGSVAVLSEAIHSSLDLMASLIAFFPSVFQRSLQILCILMDMGRLRICLERLRRS